MPGVACRSTVVDVYRFLATRGWVVRTLAGLLLVAVFVRLGIWQLDRSEQRSERNAVIEANVEAAPVPISDVIAPGDDLEADDQWRRVRLTGEYDVDGQLFLRLRPLDGQNGVHVITPLVTADGTALLVDRGFVPTEGSERDEPSVEPPPGGEVEVVARLRLSEDGRGTGGDVSSGSVRFLDVDAIDDESAYPLYGAWGELVEQDPPAPGAFQAVPPPEAEAGPHLSYAIQWFLFAVTGIGGFILLIRAEARGRRELRSTGDDDAPGVASESRTTQR
jgi:cytochrome oxidase assembly protein ShyY1